MRITIIFVLVLIIIFISNIIRLNNIEQYNLDSSKDILIIIFSCKKYKNRIENLKKIGYLDYLKKNNINYLIVTGDEYLNNEYNLDLVNNKLVVKEKDTYEALPYKVIKTFYSIYNDENLNYKYILKSDDDCIVNVERIINNMDKIHREDYVGRLNNFKHQYNPNWNGLKNKSEYYGPFMNGATGYILSQKAIDSISNSKELNQKLLKNELYEDKLIGDILRLNGFKFKKHKFWYSINKNINKISDVNLFIEKHKNVTTFFS